MRGWLGCAVLVLGAACASPLEERDVDVAVTRQATGLPMPFEGGASDASIGYSLAVCPGNVVFAGAPGVSALWTFAGGLTPSYNAVIPGWSGRVTACDQASLPLSGGTGGAARYNATGASWSPFKLGEFNAIAPEPTTGSPILLGEATGTLFFTNPSGGQLGFVDAGPRITTAVWLTSDMFVVSDSIARRLTFYGWSRGSNQPALLSVMNLTAVGGFGRSLAVGDVSPVNMGPELVVGADGRVLIYTLDGGALINTLVGAASFGATVAIEPGALLGAPDGKVDALWVGDPVGELAWRFVGDAGTSLTSFGGGVQHFGWSIVSDKQTPPRVYIGAPEYSGTFPHEGAVYSVPVRNLPPTGVLGACIGPSSCAACQDCLGGVACVLSASCDGGVVDAGVPNSMDGGAAMDAGLRRTPGLRRMPGLRRTPGLRWMQELRWMPGLRRTPGLRRMPELRRMPVLRWMPVLQRTRAPSTVA